MSEHRHWWWRKDAEARPFPFAFRTRVDVLSYVFEDTPRTVVQVSSDRVQWATVTVEEWARSLALEHVRAHLGHAESPQDVGDSGITTLPASTSGPDHRPETVTDQ